VGVVVLSQYAEPEYALALLEDGAEGRAYLLKERLFDGGELVRAVTAVAGGGSVIDPWSSTCSSTPIDPSTTHSSPSSRPESTTC